ncbi:MAG: LysM peptidoglycan-binding domain-containing protein [Flectobacillus sp.]|uniref:septal ring lytic transglycosylase RlpA family protein n=1 Tax=Flectobacillus sp. TaxID=50419 RepID=UPI003B9AA79A|eukprot:comp10985_c0_seq1/m.13616 comp10985_c0_seq1/g.13616  ORF comp10985_c0_seq1/g.13616 comp10985_c0_seq1/m.13616 type:complete len:343 (-) comp10985_c0_seq1:72-1100(-)
MLRTNANYTVMSSIKKSFSELTFTCLVLTGSAFAAQAKEVVKDSLGLVREGDKTFVKYKVEPKQTLFSIVKRFGSSVPEYKAANPGAPDGIKVGDVLKIPYNKPLRSFGGGSYASSTPAKKAEPLPQYPTTPPQQATPAPTNSPKMVTHIVEPGQGLYGIAAKYHINVTDIKKWNSLSSDNLEVGQVLIIDAAEANKRNTTEARNFIQKVDVQPNYPVASSVPSTSGASTAGVNTSEPEVKVSSEVSRSQSGFKKTTETGLAELIDVEDKSGKYLALHRSAPVGTLVNVKNVANGQSIWVKVIGRLPDLGGDKVVIKLSPRAFEKLNPVDKRIKAEINYLTP